jgi:hypothetical protein
MVQFYRDGILEMEGQRASEKPYYLDAVVKIQQDTSYATVSRSQPLCIWLERYGHVNNKTILSMVNICSVNGIQLDRDSTPPKLCIGCIKEKNTRPYLRSLQTKGKADRFPNSF